MEGYAGVAAGYDVDLWARWSESVEEWGKGRRKEEGCATLPVWSGRCLSVKGGGGMKKDWSQKEESFWPMV